MKQLLQDVRSGSLKVLDVPAPLLRPGGIVVRTRYSVISAGTERMKLEFGRKSLIRKALDRPDQVRQVLETVGREGIASTYRKVRSRLTGLSPLGYSLSGVVEEVAEEVPDFRVGDLVACAGAGYASHAERVWVPRNLAVGVPPDVPLEAAAFATLGAISLHGVHQAGVRLGESVAVIGLGLLGQLTVQVLTAAGVRSVGIDMDPDRVALVERSGALGMVREDQVVAKVEAFTGGLGVDAVIITAATQSDDPMRLAARLARDRGRVVVVGAVGMTVPRALYYEKELELRLSRSYGPGRYDRSYEETGQDYPAGYVRWTERRNLAEFLRLLSSGDVVVGPLITHRFAFADAPQAYELLGQRSAGALGVVLEYPEERRLEAPRIPLERGMRRPLRSGRVRLGLIGAGGYATATLLPLLRRLGAEPQGVATAGGVSARSAGETHGFRYLASSAEQLLADPEIDAVVIATRHQDHARLAAQALRAGKPVFVEKPLALDEESLREVLAAAAASTSPLMVGFNRRFAPATRFLQERLAGLPGGRVVHVRVNAGAVPANSWVHDPGQGGGRLIGEGCHFIDLVLALIGSPAIEVYAAALGGDDPAAPLRDNVLVTLRCADGSVGGITYTAKGNPASGKERVEVFAAGATGAIDDFRQADFWGRRHQRWAGSQDKGHAAELEAFLRCVRAGKEPPIALGEIEASSRATLRAARSLARRQPEPL